MASWPTPPTPPTRSSPLGALSLGLALLAGLALRLWLMTQNAGITMDSPLYTRMAVAIAHGDRALGPAHHGYSALMALLGFFVPGEILPGRIVSLVASLALLVVVYALARRTLSPLWSSLAVWLIALHPLAAVYGGVVMTEATVIALGYAALLLLEHRWFAAGGLAFGAAYLVRPEALVLAALALPLSRGGRRGALMVLTGMSLVLIPYVGYLRWERGSWMISPKTVLVRPTLLHGSAEWKVGAEAPQDEQPRSFVERVRWAAPSVARNYGPGLIRHLGVLLGSWPWHLIFLSALGLLGWWRPLLAPLILVAALPLLAVPPDARFSLLTIPALAVFAASGGAWVTQRLSARPRLARAAVAVTVALAAAALVWLWSGRTGMSARFFDDGPMKQMRDAGEWLRAHGKPGARVMDRKSYVPFFAGMEHVQLPNDDYETIVAFAQREGVSYLVLEEYVVRSLRRQLAPLADDPAFQAREKRLRLVYVTGSEPGNGVAVLQVVRDSSATPAPAPGAP